MGAVVKENRTHVIAHELLSGLLRSPATMTTSPMVIAYCWDCNSSRATAVVRFLIKQGWLEVAYISRGGKEYKLTPAAHRLH